MAAPHVVTPGSDGASAALPPKLSVPSVGTTATAVAATSALMLGALACVAPAHAALRGLSTRFPLSLSAWRYRPVSQRAVEVAVLQRKLAHFECCVVHGPAGVGASRLLRASCIRYCTIINTLPSPHRRRRRAGKTALINTAVHKVPGVVRE